MNAQGIMRTAVFKAIVPAMVFAVVLSAGVAQAADDTRVSAALLPLKPGKQTAPEFADLATREARSLLSKATWLSLAETDRTDRVLAEIAKSHARDYDQDQALATGKQLQVQWVCTGTADAYIYKERPEDEASWWGAVVIIVQATSVETGATRVLKEPIRQRLIGIKPDEAKKMIFDCARTSGQMAGDQIAQWLAPECSVVEVDGKHCLIDRGSSSGVAAKQKFRISYTDSTARDKAKRKTTEITVDQVGSETASAKVPGNAAIRVGDRAQLIPNLRSAAAGGLGTFFRSAVLGGLSQNPNVRGAVGDTAATPYTGPPVAVGVPADPTQPGASAAAPWLTEVSFQNTGEMDLNVAMASGIAFNRQGEMLVTDGASNKIIVYGPDGVMRRTLEVPSAAGGPPSGAHAIGINDLGEVFISERNGCRVFQLNDAGAKQFCAGSGTPDGCKPTTALAVDRQRNVHVGDWNGHLFTFSHDGQLIARLDSLSGDLPHHRLSIEGAAMGPDGSLYVTDGMYARLVKFSPSGEVQLVASLERGSATPRMIYGLAIDPQGYAWVLPMQANDVFVVSPDGKITPVSRRILPEKLRPQAIAFDPEGNLCVFDGDSVRFRKFHVDDSALPLESH